MVWGKNKRRYHLVKWSHVCRSKKKGGIGVKDLQKQNISLLSKWWWQLGIGKALWQDIVKDKYLKRSSTAYLKQKFNKSSVWKSLLKVKEYYMTRRGIYIRVGDVARLWHDSITMHPPLRVTYPDLFSIANFPDDMVSQFQGRGGWIAV